MRARNIKPGFFANDRLVSLDPIYRLLFVGLWCMADRRGLVEDRPAKIKLTLFPGDNIDVEAGIAALVAGGFLVRYVDAKGTTAISVVNFSRHQNPHQREKENPDIEPPESSDSAPVEPKPNGPKPVTPAAGRPGAGTGPARLIPDSGFLIPDSGLLNPEGGAGPGRPAAGTGPGLSRPATLKQTEFAARLLDGHGLTVSKWLANHGAGAVLLDGHVDRIKADYSEPPAPRRAYEIPQPPDPELTAAERNAGLAALARLRAAGGLPVGRPAATVGN